MIQVDWNPVPHWGPVPVNSYGITFALGSLVGGGLARRWAPAYGISRDYIERLLIWLVIGTIAGARLYFVVQNDLLGYVSEPWRILAIWEGGSERAYGSGPLLGGPSHNTSPGCLRG